MLIIVTDTYQQVNGVSTTYKNLEKVAAQRNIDLKIIHPGLFKWVPMPFYPEIQLAIQPIKLWRLLNQLKPLRVHIATEGAIGIVTRMWCKWHKKTFTSAYHTKFPEYLKVLFGIPEKFTYWHMHRFHSAAKATFVATKTVRSELQQRHFKNLVVWTRGVSDELVWDALNEKQTQRAASDKLRVLSVGRVSKEKNLDALCVLQDKFDITIVGDGVYLDELKAKYKNIRFLGYKFGKELAQIYAQHDVFAFPSYTDTFGLVMIEAMCNGLPVAAYNTTGPKDVVEHGVTGVLHADLCQAIIACKTLNHSQIKRDSLAKWSWDNCFDIFKTHFESELS